MSGNEPIKEWAAHTLSDELVDMSLNLEYAEIIMNDISVEYFGLFGDNDPDNANLLVMGFTRHRIKSEIVTDYLFLVRKTLQKLSDMANNFSKALHQSQQEPP